MSVTIVIPHYFEERLDNLKQIIENLKGYNVLVWNNDKPIDIPSVDIIQSPYNLGCKARFLAGLASKGEYVLFQDNDVLIEPNLIEEMLSCADPDRIVSLDGRILNGKSYVHSDHVGCNNVLAPTIVDISLGRAELVHKSLISRLLALIPFDRAIMDDIWFSYAAKECGIPIVVISTETKLIELNENGVGMSVTDTEHYDKRNQLCNQLFI